MLHDTIRDYSPLYIVDQACISFLHDRCLLKRKDFQHGVHVGLLTVEQIDFKHTGRYLQWTVVQAESHEESREDAVGLDVGELLLDVRVQVGALLAQMIDKELGDSDNFGQVRSKDLTKVSLRHETEEAPENLLFVLDKKKE